MKVAEYIEPWTGNPFDGEEHRGARFFKAKGISTEVGSETIEDFAVLMDGIDD